MDIDKSVRPWGFWEILDRGEGYAVKRLTVNPHSRLSFQRHEFRRERWVVVVGVASVQIASHSFKLRPGGVAEIGLAVPHRLTNHEGDPLIVIESQLGAYLGEDDIERLEDDYGRIE